MSVSIEAPVYAHDITVIEETKLYCAIVDSTGKIKKMADVADPRFGMCRAYNNLDVGPGLGQMVVIGTEEAERWLEANPPQPKPKPKPVKIDRGLKQLEKLTKLEPAQQGGEYDDIHFSAGRDVDGILYLCVSPGDIPYFDYEPNTPLVVQAVKALQHQTRRIAAKWLPKNGKRKAGAA